MWIRNSERNEIVWNENKFLMNLKHAEKLTKALNSTGMKYIAK